MKFILTRRLIFFVCCLTVSSVQVQDILMNIRGNVGQAEQLYAELQCGIQHAREVRCLEAGVEAVTNWVLGPGADLLRHLVLRGIGTDPDSVLSLQQDLEHLELKCRVIFNFPEFRVF